MRSFTFIFILVALQAACQTKKEQKAMSTDTFASASPMVDTFQLADDVLIPYRVGDKFGYCDKDRNIVIELG